MPNEINIRNNLMSVYQSMVCKIGSKGHAIDHVSLVVTVDVVLCM